MYTFAPIKKEVISFTRQAVDAKPKAPINKYVPPSNRKDEQVQKTFDELFPTLTSGDISLNICTNKSDKASTTVKSFAERIREKLEKEQREKDASEAEKALPEDMRDMIFPNFKTLYRVREEEQKKKAEKKEWLNKIFDSSDEDLAYSPEDNLSEIYPLDDDDDQDNNDDFHDGNEYN
jgi:hypothetical protein